MNYEKVLKDKIFPELEKGRPNWDKPHTEAVVFYVKEIIKHSKELELDKDVLVIAGYAHDWGYAGLFKGGKHLSLDEINSEKKLHMILGAEKLARLLNNKVFDFLTSKQKKRAIHLVGVHDKLNLLKDTDELVLMEADTLASLDAKKTKPSFDKASNAKYMQSVLTHRYPLFIANYSKQLFNELFGLREKYYEKL